MGGLRTQPRRGASVHPNPLLRRLLRKPAPAGGCPQSRPHVHCLLELLPRSISKLRGGAGGNDGQICRRRGTRSEVPLHPPRTLNQVVLLRDCLDALREPHHQHTDRGPLAHSVGPAQGGVRDLRLGPLPLTAYTSPSGRIPRLFPGTAGFAFRLVAALSRWSPSLSQSRFFSLIPLLH